MASVLNNIAFIVGATITVSGALALCAAICYLAANYAAKRFLSTSMVALYWWHRKDFHQWCRDHQGDMLEFHRNIVSAHVPQQAGDGAEEE